jgi:hypothetical protein
MKRLMWGAFLFFATAGSLTPLDACDWKSLFMDPQHATVFREGGNTIVISSDDEFITIVTYANSDQSPAEWM